MFVSSGLLDGERGQHISVTAVLGKMRRGHVVRLRRNFATSNIYHIASSACSEVVARHFTYSADVYTLGARHALVEQTFVNTLGHDRQLHL